MFHAWDSINLDSSWDGKSFARHFLGLEILAQVSLQNRRDILRISGEHRRKRGGTKRGLMLDIPSQYMHYCLVLLFEVYCVIV